MKANEILTKFEKICNDGLNFETASQVMKLIGIDGYDADTLRDFRIWFDYLPISDENPYTEEQKCLHILWDVVDLIPLGMNCAFTIPYHQIIAKKLFKKCGKGFITGEKCRFNVGHQIEVGDNVSWNSGVYIDSKGGVEFGDYSMLAENVQIYTHTHTELNHMVREYHKVIIKPYATCFSGVRILPGVTIGKGSMVATGSVVSHDVPDLTVVAGSPAKELRKRIVPEGGIENVNHYFFKDKLFQK